ncbi:hypothetical protein [Cognatishimia sp. MH4019]|uniref:hypothetical protein n=1 Tax=Cognatishimia sp. MH4019 TaxID=2854030 RepID=UPI001CD24297|nr:hypothetical protein [Cognatishimia sp. MH4019]
MTFIDITTLKRMVFSFESHPPRTADLEKRIKIGSAFHNKWYKSQRDHMLGWMVVQECQARKSGNHPTMVDAQGMWNRLKCSPLMFWLAECGGVSNDVLCQAEIHAVRAAELNPKDGDPHGAMMRTVLPWTLVATAISAQPLHQWDDNADQAAEEAFQRLIAKNAAYRPLAQWLEGNTNQLSGREIPSK